MNDIEARRLLLADPHHVSPQLREAIERRPALAQLREELLRQDENVRLAATAAPLPDGLADRMVLAARYRKRSTFRLAIAAAIVSVAIAVPWYAAIDSRVEVAMMDHVRESVGELSDNGGVDVPVLRTSLAGLGVDLREAPFRVRHLGHCIVGGIQGRHFTVDGPHGIVSFVLLPAQAGSAPRSLVEDGTVGVFEQHGRFLIGAFASAGTDENLLRTLVQRMFA
jgi:hypothetical protein